MSGKLKLFLENNKIYFETITATLISIMAILVSISQCSISKDQAELLKVQNSISRNMYLATLNPDVRVRFKDNKNEKSFDIIIKNYGIELVYEIKIKNSFRIFNINSSTPLLSVSDSDFKSILDTLYVGDSIIYKIPKDEFINPTINNFIIDKKTGFPIITSRVSYRRYPDNKEFTLTKHLLLLYNPKDGIIGSIDLDKSIIPKEMFNREKLLNN